MTRKFLISGVVGLLLAASAISPASAHDSGVEAGPKVERRTFQAGSSQSASDSFQRLQLRNLRTGATVNPFASSRKDPTICDAQTSFSGVANYVDGVLTSVTIDYWAQVFCPTGLPMGAILVTAQMWKDVTLQDEGPTVNCVNCVTSPVSSDIFACGGVGCAGTYWSANLYGLRAPDGYVWNGVPPGCIGSPPYEWLQCSEVSGTAVVPPNV